jgi:hypothetical protein
MPRHIVQDESCLLWGLDSAFLLRTCGEKNWELTGETDHDTSSRFRRSLPYHTAEYNGHDGSPVTWDRDRIMTNPGTSMGKSLALTSCCISEYLNELSIQGWRHLCVCLQNWLYGPHVIDIAEHKLSKYTEAITETSSPPRFTPRLSHRHAWQRTKRRVDVRAW